LCSHILRRSFTGNELNDAAAIDTIPNEVLQEVKANKSDYIFRFKFGLPARLYLLQQAFPKKYEAIIKHFKAVFPEYPDIRITVQKTGSHVTPALLFREKNVHPNLGLHDLSSGIKKVLLIITDVISMTGDSIYLLDEYENSLGLNAIDFLPSFLNECGHDNQFVVTTHHPYLINNMPTENWKIFHREGSKVSIKCGAEMSEKYKHSKQDAFIQLINDPFYSEGAS